MDVFNNLLSKRNEEGWSQLQTVRFGSQTLLQNAERYGAYLTTTLNDTNESLIQARENISKCNHAPDPTFVSKMK